MLQSTVTECNNIYHAQRNDTDCDKEDVGSGEDAVTADNDS